LELSTGMTNSNQHHGKFHVDISGATSAAHILKIIRNHDGVSRAELSRITGLSRSTISQHVDTLQKMELVCESGTARSTGGRKARLLQFKKDGGYVISIDLGATSLGVALCGLEAEPVAVDMRDFDVAASPCETINRAQRIAAELMESAGVDQSQIKGVGMGVPGPIEFKTGTLVGPAILRGWNKYPIANALQSRFGCPAYVDNDANVMALGELWAGAGKGAENFIFVKIGTGIGAGIVCGGQLYRGADGCAGDIGHIAVDYSDVMCACGNRGCLEALAAGGAIARRAERAAVEGTSQILVELMREHGQLTAKDIGVAALKGDPVSAEIIRDSGRLIGMVIAKAITFFNPSLVIVGGGVSKTGDLLLASIRESIYRRSLPLATRNLLVKSSTLDDRAGIIGAAVLVLEELFSPNRIAQVIAESS
jgi:glucokinase-like ROK family protein